VGAKIVKKQVVARVCLQKKRDAEMRLFYL
jgi:hypothetical protein